MCCTSIAPRWEQHALRGNIHCRCSSFSLTYHPFRFAPNLAPAMPPRSPLLPPPSTALSPRHQISLLPPPGASLSHADVGHRSELLCATELSLPPNTLFGLSLFLPSNTINLNIIHINANLPG